MGDNEAPQNIKDMMAKIVWEEAPAVKVAIEEEIKGGTTAEQIVKENELDSLKAGLTTDSTVKKPLSA